MHDHLRAVDPLHPRGGDAGGEALTCEQFIRTSIYPRGGEICSDISPGDVNNNNSYPHSSHTNHSRQNMQWVRLGLGFELRPGLGSGLGYGYGRVQGSQLGVKAGV